MSNFRSRIHKINILANKFAMSNFRSRIQVIWNKIIARHGIFAPTFYSERISEIIKELLQKYHVYLQLDWTSNTSQQKNNLPTNQRDYDTFETTVGKLSARRIQICCAYFSLIIFWPPIFLNKSKHGPNKNMHGRFGFASSNNLVPRSQVLLRCLGLLAN